MADPNGHSFRGSINTGTLPCSIHPGKQCDLFCVTCESVICCDCLSLARDHLRHSIDTVRDVYARRFPATQSKLEALCRYVQELRIKAEHHNGLLKLLKSNETGVLERIDRILERARSEVIQSVRDRAKKLESFRLMVNMKSYYKQELLNEVVSLTEAERLARQADINARCRFLMSTTSEDFPEASEESCNVTCSLLPTIDLTIYRVQFDERNECHLSVTDAIENTWTLKLIRSEWLRLHVKIDQNYPLVGNFVILLEILHDLLLKTISFRIPVDLNHSNSDPAMTELIEMDKLKQQGFIAKDGTLRFRCGFGPADPVSERSWYKSAWGRQKDRIVQLEKRIANRRKICIGYLFMKFGKIGSHHSHPVLDSLGCKWQLSVHVKSNVNFIGVLLKKVQGPSGWYDYFVELMHPNSDDQNRRVAGCHLFDGKPLDLPQFVAAAFVARFVTDGTLRFRFGTQADTKGR